MPSVPLIVRRKARMAMLGTPFLSQVFGRGREPGEGEGENVFGPQPGFNNAPVNYAVCTVDSEEES
jgi:hypothetical protein